jgi:hypothetical protein
VRDIARRYGRPERRCFFCQQQKSMVKNKMEKDILGVSMSPDGFIDGLHNQTEHIDLERTRVVVFPGVIHLWFREVR